jgi:transcriptional regulator with GAF, ATPase, and Fis domain/tetratricopeptide (TPR) repeat protein
MQMPTHGDNPMEGTLLAGRYRIGRRLGAGVQGTVWSAVDTRSGDAPVAVKRAAGLAARREAEVLLRVEHAALPRVTDFVRDAEGGQWLVMTRVEGTPLGPKTPVDRVAHAAASVAGALAALHDAGIVHGDVKPDNVLVGEAHTWLVDLGLAGDIRRVGEVPSGTLRYLAPERLAGERGVASDLHALGITLVEALTGEHPFVTDPDDRGALLHALAHGTAPRATVLAKLPDAMRAPIAWLLEPDPERRPWSARQWHARWMRDVGLAGEIPRLGDTAPMTRRPLVGREAERRMAVEKTLAALSGEGLGVVVVGPSGAGKRRLAEEVVRACRIVGAAQGASPEVRRELPNSFERPALVVLVDVAEDTLTRTVEALHRLRRFGASGASVALLATCSSPLEAEGLTQVVLQPFDRPRLRELLAELHGSPVPAATVDAWDDVTAGLPGRVVGIAQRLGVHRLTVATRDELYAQAASLHRVPLPAGPSSLRRAAAMLAVAGAPLRETVLAEALGTEAQSALVGLIALGLARVCDGWVLALTPLDAGEDGPSAARALLPVLQRLAPTEHVLRARVALAVGDREAAWAAAERCATDPRVPRSDAVAVLVSCEHVVSDLGRWAERLAGTLLLAGEASRALEVLARVPPTVATRLVELDALRRTGQRERARALAHTLVAAPETRALGYLALARDAFDQGRLTEAHACLREVETPCSDATLQLRVLELEALLAIAQDDLDVAREATERADVLALQVGEVALRARVRALMGMAAQRGGDHDTARRCYTDAWGLACASGDLHAAAVYRANLGGAALDAGDPGEALRAIAQASQALAALGRMPELARVLANEASLHAWIGDRVAAKDAASRAVEAARLVGDALTEGFAAMVAGDALDDPQQGATAMLAAARRLRAVGDHPRADEAAARAALRLLRAGAVAEATAALEGTDEARAMVALARLELALATGATQREVEARLATVRARCAVDRAAEHELWLLRAEVAVARARGDRAGAEEAEEVMRRRVEALAATLPAELGRRFKMVHAPPSVAPPGGAREAARWRRLVAVTQRLNDEHRLRVLLERVVDATVELTGASRGFVLLKGDDGALRIRTARNIGARDLAGDEMAFSRSVAEHVARTGEPLMTVDASADGRFHTAASVASMRLRSVLVVPLKVHGEVVGTVYVDDRFRVGAFDDEAMEVAQAFADAAAVAIYNARVRSELQRALRRAERLSEELERRVDAQRVELEAVRQTLARDVARGRYPGIIGRGPAMQRLLGLVDRVAPTGMPVLLLGESGTGKELIARAIHANSARASRPFVAENCGAVPETLLESTLFGHVRGAFTGADRNRAGLFEVADGGTLFLDEVGEMSPAMQARLLRVLQEGEVRPVGGERSRRVDVRVIAATHRDLTEMVRRGTFREDLYYRLAVMVLSVPPLRERREDIPALVAHFLSKVPGKKVEIDRKAMARLMAAPWPGNVRQLENEVMRAAVLADGIIRESDLTMVPLAGTASSTEPAPGDGEGPALDLRHAVTDVERALVERALREHGWNQSRAARALGLSRFGLQKKLKRLGIPSRDPGRAARPSRP